MELKVETTISSVLRKQCENAGQAVPNYLTIEEEEQDFEVSMTCEVPIEEMKRIVANAEEMSNEEMEDVMIIIPLSYSNANEIGRRLVRVVAERILKDSRTLKNGYGRT